MQHLYLVSQSEGLLGFSRGEGGGGGTPYFDNFFLKTPMNLRTFNLWGRAPMEPHWIH